MFNEEYSDLLKGLFEGVYIVDRNRKIVFWNSGSEHITGYKSSEVLNKHCFDNILRHVDVNGNELCFGGCPLHKTLDTGVENENKVFLHHKNGHRVPVTVRTFPLYDDKGDIVAAVEVFSDSEYKKSVYKENRRLQELLIMDPLTKVYNRRYIDFQLEKLILEYKQFEQTFGVVFIDIDDFKHVNDNYGHSVGDEVLIMLAKTIASNLRTSDIVGRWGGEEFVVFTKVGNEKELGIISEKLRILVEKSSIKVNGSEFNVTVSMGASMFNGLDDSKSIIERADKAMYESKKSGKNRITII